MLAIEILNHIKQWVEQNQDGISKEIICETVARQCAEGIQELQAVEHTLALDGANWCECEVTPRIDGYCVTCGNPRRPTSKA